MPKAFRGAEEARFKGGFAGFMAAVGAVGAVGRGFGGRPVGKPGLRGVACCGRGLTTRATWR